MRVIFIRHGETDWNVALRYQGHGKVPLNERGQQQARQAGARLAHYGATALYSSDIVRAAETAAIISEQVGLSPRPLPTLREIDVGQWEGFTPEELYRRFPEHMQEFDRDPARTVRLGGESYAQLQQRALEALQTIQAAHRDDEVVLAVSHGGTIRALLCHVIGLDLVNFGRLWIDNGSFTELRSATQGWRLVRLNDSAHSEGMVFASGD